MLAESSDTFWFAQLDEEAHRLADQPSFHVFAEGMHSDARGQIFNLDAGASLDLPHEKWPDHFFVVLGLAGTVVAEVSDRKLQLTRLSQLAVLPGVACRLTAKSKASLQLLSFVSKAQWLTRRSSGLAEAMLTTVALALAAQRLDVGRLLYRIAWGRWVQL